MSEPDRCERHLNKKIFQSIEHARIYMVLYHPETLYRTYPCPFYPHLHVLNKSKRNYNRKKALKHNRRLRERNEQKSP